jgi:hypothetical protein
MGWKDYEVPKIAIWRAFLPKKNCFSHLTWSYPPHVPVWAHPRLTQPFPVRRRPETWNGIDQDHNVQLPARGDRRSVLVTLYVTRGSLDRRNYWRTWVKKLSYSNRRRCRHAKHGWSTCTYARWIYYKSAGNNLLFLPRSAINSDWLDWI